MIARIARGAAMSVACLCVGLVLGAHIEAKSRPASYRVVVVAHYATPRPVDPRCHGGYRINGVASILCLPPIPPLYKEMP